MIDVDRADANIARAQAAADRHGLKLRPHIKTHKLPYLRQEAGRRRSRRHHLPEDRRGRSDGRSRLPDIFLPYNILGSAKLARLLALHREVTLSVTADSDETLAGLAATFTDPGTGSKCWSNATPAWAAAACRRQNKRSIWPSGSSRFRPVVRRPDDLSGRRQARRDRRLVADARDVLAGGPRLRGHLQRRHARHLAGRRHQVVTDTGPAPTSIIDRYQVAKGVGTVDDCALTVLSTVVSHPTPTRAILDAGSKALSSDTLGLPDFGELDGMPGALVDRPQRRTRHRRRCPHGAQLRSASG